MRAAIYLRISQDRTGEAAGVDRQREDCLALAEELGWTVAEVYQDNDTSATSGVPRPDYRRMLADIESRQVEAVIAWHTDRLYRRLTDLEELIPVCERHHVAVRTCRAGELDLATPTGRMLARILGSVATHEGEQKADRWRRSYRQRREAGRWMASGPRTYGYNRDGTICEVEAETIRYAVEQIISGTGTMAVCRWMHAQGQRTTRGNTWAPTALRILLTNPRIAGLATMAGEVIGPGEWEPILDRETWERVGAALRRQAHSSHRTARRSLLAGLAVCGWPDCGRNLIRSHSGKTPTYRCKTDRATGQHVLISAERLEPIVEAYARARLSDPQVRHELAARSASAGSNAERLTSDIDRTEAEIRELEATLTTGGRSKAAVVRAIDDLYEHLDQVRAEYANLASVPLPVGDDWPTNLQRRAALIGLVVAKVRIMPVATRGRFDPSRVKIDPVR